MANTGITRKILSISPYIEVAVRHIYWHTIKIIKPIRKFLSSSNGAKEEIKPVNFKAIKDYLSEIGVKPGTLLLLHSAYKPLKGTSLKPPQIVDELLQMLGPDGTLAMPAIPGYPEDFPIEQYLTADVSTVTYRYDVQKSPITTGALPIALFNKPGSIRSRHPINSMVVYGKLATKITENNLVSNDSLPCGTESSWNHCAENNALIVALGVDMTHSLTSIHIVEDILDESWPIKDWYRKKKFIVKDNDYEGEFLLKERRPKWGALHYGERTLSKDLLESGLMKSHVIDGVLVESIYSKDLLNFLNSRNKNGYPYFGW